MKVDTSKADIEGFWVYSQVHLKYKNAIRHSGSITALTKTHVRFGLKLLEITEGFLWFLLEKSVLQLENKVFLCETNILPNNTTPSITTKTDYFGKLNEMLIKWKDKEDKLNMGDLNTRTGNEDSLHEKLGNQLGHLLPKIEATTLKTGNRCSCDGKLNNSVRKL